MDTFRRLFSYAEEKKGFMISALATILSFVPYYYFLQLLREITSNTNPDLITSYSYRILGATIAYAFAYLLTLSCSHIFAFRIETNKKNNR